VSTGTQTEVVMPQMGVSVSEGTITKWLRQVGDTIGRDEPLLEISTDKVDTEVPSPAEGVVTQILVQEGETVEVGTVLATIGPAGAEVAPAAPEPAPPTPASEPEQAPVAAAPTPEPAPAEPPAAPATPAPPTSPVEPVAAGNGKTFVSPVVARIAAEHGIDPTSVPGTGTGGRVTKKDILSFIESGAATAPPAAPEPAPAAEAAPPPAPEPEPAPAAQPEPEPVAAALAPVAEPAPAEAPPANAPAHPPTTLPVACRDCAPNV
jgi:pyruvate dehydrogenase E2 component (dihydrolipoamide acetyltransferase)